MRLVLMIIFLSIGCGYSGSPSFVNAEGERLEIYEGKGLELGFQYLADDDEAYGHDASSEKYYQHIKWTYYVRLQMIWDKETIIRNVKFKLKDGETGEVYPEDVVYYDEQYPIVKFDTLSDYIKSNLFKPYKRIDIVWKEKKLRKCQSAIAEIDIEYVYKGKRETVRFKTKKMIRKSRYREWMVGCF
jgi:hypothetical protein